MSTTTQILEALFGEVSAFAIAQGNLPIAWPNVHFEPPQAGRWLEVIALVDDVNDFGLAQGDAAILRGTLRVGVCDQTRGGIVNATELATLVQQNWAKTNTITGTTARIESTPSIASPLEFDDRLTVYTSIRWWDTI